MVQISIKVSGANNVMKNLGVIQKRVRKAEDEIAEALAKDVQKVARQRIASNLGKWGSTGNLSRNTMARKLRKGVWTTESKAPYAAALEFGSKPHAIPNNPWKNTWKTSPIHPGNRPYHFMQDSFESTSRRAKTIAERAINKAIGGKT